MKKRSYDFLGFAGAFVVLSAVVALWAGSQSHNVVQAHATSALPAAAAPSDSAPTTTTQTSSQAVTSQSQEMGKTNLQTGAGAPITKSIAWETSYESAVQRARAEGKPLLVDFYTDWCVYCKKLDSEVYTNSGIIATSGQFVCVKVNAEKRRDLAGAYGVTGFPTVVFVRADTGGNTLLRSLPGFVDAPRFAQLLAQAQSQYQQTNTRNA